MTKPSKRALGPHYPNAISGLTVHGLIVEMGYEDGDDWELHCPSCGYAIEDYAEIKNYKRLDLICCPECEEDDDEDDEDPDDE